MDPSRLPISKPLDVLDTAARNLLRAVPADVWCAIQLDPSTMLDTGGLHEYGFPAESMGRLFEIEHVEQDDVDNIRALARRGATSSVLSLSTPDGIANSKYYRDVLRPLDLADELRVLLRDNSRVWGLLVLCRAAGAPPFTRADLARGDAVSRTTTDALRRSLLLSGRDQPQLPDTPGVLFLGPDLDITWTSGRAELWLERIRERGRAAEHPYPYAIHALATRSRTTLNTHGVRAHVPDGEGGWVSLHAWSDGQAGEARTVISLGPTEITDLVAVILDVLDLTPRERDVTQQVILGRSTGEIARNLHMSSYTVQDHLKAVFRKTGVTTRGRLSAKLFFEHYLPQLSNPPLSTDGRLTGGAGCNA